MRIVLVGADFGENLGIGTIGAAATRAGHDVTIVPFDHPDDEEATVAAVLGASPDVVGLGIQFL